MKHLNLIFNIMFSFVLVDFAAFHVNCFILGGNSHIICFQFKYGKMILTRDA